MIDANSSAFDMLKNIINEESLTNIKAKRYNINRASVDADYGFICSALEIFRSDTVFLTSDLTT